MSVGGWRGKTGGGTSGRPQLQAPSPSLTRTQTLRFERTPTPHPERQVWARSRKRGLLTGAFHALVHQPVKK